MILYKGNILLTKYIAMGGKRHKASQTLGRLIETERWNAKMMIITITNRIAQAMKNFSE